MNPILVIGRNGQVARQLRRRAAGRGIALVAIGRPELDLADAASIERAFDTVRPRLVINAAAYTAVDRAEAERDAAFAINAEGPRRLAEAAGRTGIPLIHLSTDYVFDGRKGSPYAEDDAPAPLNVYGASKAAGERAVLAAHPDGGLVFRTSWVFDEAGPNFVTTMLRLGRERPELRVVDDQIGAPTYAADIAGALLDIAGAIAADGLAGRHGLYHLTAGGETSWCGFAAAIMAEAARRGWPAATVVPIGSDDYPTRAQRPLNSRLSHARLEADWGIALPDWRDGLRRCLDAIAAATGHEQAPGEAKRA